LYRQLPHSILYPRERDPSSTKWHLPTQLYPSVAHAAIGNVRISKGFGSGVDARETHSDTDQLDIDKKVVSTAEYAASPSRTWLMRLPSAISAIAKMRSNRSTMKNARYLFGAARYSTPIGIRKVELKRIIEPLTMSLIHFAL
jgi:hypothetical protein